MVERCHYFRRENTRNTIGIYGKSLLTTTHIRQRNFSSDAAIISLYKLSSVTFRMIQIISMTIKLKLRIVFCISLLLCHFFNQLRSRHLVLQRVVQAASCLRGELSTRRVVLAASSLRRVVCGELSCGELC